MPIPREQAARFAQLLMVGVLFAALTAPAARSADPATGEVSASATELNWAGDAPGGPFTVANLGLVAVGQPVFCEFPFCDVFTLRVAHTADLQIESSTCASLVTQVEVERPDGTRLFASGADRSPRTIIDIPAAPVGTYVVRTLVDTFIGAPSTYVGHAKLLVQERDNQAEVLAPAGVGAASPTRLTLRSGRVPRTARGRRVVVRIASSAAVNDVRAVLRRGRRTVASGRLSRLDGEGALRLRALRGLTPGPYRLGLKARDATGPVGGSFDVAVTRARPLRRPEPAPRSASRAASGPELC